MGNIVDSFRIILGQQKKLNYHFPNILRPPATSQDIVMTERSLSLSFNSELRELYSVADGTDIDDVTPCGLTGLIPIHNFLSLEDADRKSTRLNSSHVKISYAVFCLKKK